MKLDELTKVSEFLFYFQLHSNFALHISSGESFNEIQWHLIYNEIGIIMIEMGDDTHLFFFDDSFNIVFIDRITIEHIRIGYVV